MITSTNTATPDGFVHATVSPEATSVSANEHSGYRLLGRTFNHGVVRNVQGLSEGRLHTNTIDGV